MPFFNSKRFEVVDVASQDVVELDASNSLSFYIKDIFSDTVIASVQYLEVKTSGRSETIVGSYTTIGNVSGDMYTFSITPSGYTTSDTVKFRLKIEDFDGDEHFLYTDSYKIVTT